MTPPPPSQAGKFKPRKPAAKVIQPGAAAAAAPTAPAVPISSTTAGPVGGRGHAQRGSGRGRGRGGRGMPMPQGQVFFTGTPAPLAASKSSRGGRGAASSGGQGPMPVAVSSAFQGQQEQVLGHMEQGVGEASLRADPIMSAASEYAVGDTRDPASTSQKATRTAPAPAARSTLFIYDSDSDEESSQMQVDSLPQPLTLPFPPSHIVGADPDGAPLCSPFTSDRNDRESPWFLVQLPTRLPPVVIPPSKDESQALDHENATPMGDVEGLAVAVSPVTRNFDNALASAPPGRLGRIRIHRSGKAELIFDSAEPQSREPVSCAQGPGLSLFVLSRIA
jgi:hypothetical protein